MDDAFTVARSSHRGPVFVDIPMDEFFNSATGPASAGTPAAAARARRRRPRGRGDRLLAEATRPLLILGTDVWADRAEEAALRFVEALGIPTITNGMGRGIVPGGHPLLVTKARGRGHQRRRPRRRRRHARSTSASATASSAARTAPRPARVVHVADSPGQLSPHATLAASVAGDLSSVLDGLARAGAARPARRLVHLGRRARPTSSGRRSPATASCSPPRPTRSTRPASTASWSPAWPTTRS